MSSKAKSILAQIHSEVAEWVWLPNYWLLDTLCATVVANRLEGPPVWLLMLGPSGGGKSTLMDALLGVEPSWSIGDITAQTFVSGWSASRRAAAASFLSRIADIQTDEGVWKCNGPKFVIMKDLTSLLDRRNEVRGEIMSQMRHIHDGHYEKAFGTGLYYQWAGKRVIFAGCTTAWDDYWSVNRVLGERFLLWRETRKFSREITGRVFDLSGQNELMRKRLETAMALLNDVPIQVVPDFRPSYEYLTFLINWCTELKRVAHRGFDRRLDKMDDSDRTGRFAGAFAQLTKALMILHDQSDPMQPEIMIPLARLAASHIPPNRLRVLAHVPEGGITSTDLRKLTRLDRSTQDRALEELRIIRVLGRDTEKVDHVMKGYGTWKLLAAQMDSFIRTEKWDKDIPEPIWE